MAAKHAVLGIENGAFSYGATPVFRNVSFLLDGARTGMVGENGAGKSTLLRCLIGELELNSGAITRSKNMHLSYVPQETPDAYLKLTVRQVMERSLKKIHSDEDWRIDVLLDELGVSTQDSERPFGSFSGGWQRITLIASASALEEPDILLLDEPTNHLDSGHINKLEDWLLNHTNVPLLAISHDRDFLEAVTTRTLFLRSDGAHMFRFPFTEAREQLFERDALNARRAALEAKEIERLEEMVKRYKAWGVLNSKFHKKQKSTEKRIARMQDKATESYVARKRELKLHDGGMEAKVALRIENYPVTIPDGSRTLYKIDRFQISPGERIALLGPNGAGKTMLLDALSRAYDPKREHYDGTSAIRYNPGAKVVHFDQRMRQLPLDSCPLDYVCEDGLVGRTQGIALLAKAGFPYKRAESAIEELSYGERSRLIFLRMRLLKPNVYLLDEPTNHLDIEGQEDLEAQLEEAEVACIFVSHDRYFVRTAATRFLEIRKNKLVEIEDPDEFFDAQ
jgi:ATPase subunit of ABC transporter with duplicated ATPase domains